MIIWVDDRLFQEGACDVDRFALLRGAAKRRHTLLISADPRDTKATRAAPAFARWKDALPTRLQREINLLMECLAIVSANATTRGAERLLVSAFEWPDVHGCRITLDEAVRAVVLPTYVLVENAINDGAFLRHAMPPKWRERLEKWEATGLLRYEQGGGITELRNIVEHHADDNHSRTAFGLPSKLWCRVHVVIYDHDGNDAEHPHQHSINLELACSRAGLQARSHRLARRKQENYLPRAAMEAIVEEIFKHLPRERETHLAAMDAHFAQDDHGHFQQLPNEKKFKNAFARRHILWRDEWFEDVWPEMTKIAEMIATAI